MSSIVSKTWETLQRCAVFLTDDLDFTMSGLEILSFTCLSVFVCRLSGVPWERRLIFWMDDYVRSLTSPRWVVRCLFVPQGCSFPCTWSFQGLLEKASLARETSARFIHHFCGEKFLESDHVPRFRIFSATAPKDRRSFSSPSTLRR